MMMLENQAVTLRVPCLHALSPARRAIVEVLHRSPAAAISQIGDELGVTPSAVRSHLVNLEEAGLVAATTERCGTPGRPKRRYRLTMSARSLFSKRAGQDASEFAQAILREVRRRDPQLVANVVTELSASPRWAETAGGGRNIGEARLAASAS